MTEQIYLVWNKPLQQVFAWRSQESAEAYYNSLTRAELYGVEIELTPEAIVALLNGDGNYTLLAGKYGEQKNRVGG